MYKTQCPSVWFARPYAYNIFIIVSLQHTFAQSHVWSQDQRKTVAISNEDWCASEENFLRKAIYPQTINSNNKKKLIRTNRKENRQNTPHSSHRFPPIHTDTVIDGFHILFPSGTRKTVLFIFAVYFYFSETQMAQTFRLLYLQLEAKGISRIAMSPLYLFSFHNKVHLIPGILVIPCILNPYPTLFMHIIYHSIAWFRMVTF